MKPESLRRRLFKAIYHKNRLLLAASLLVLITMEAFNLMLSYLLQQLTDIAAGQEVGPVIRMAWACLWAMALFAALYLLHRAFTTRFARRAMVQYKTLAFEEITKKNIASFASENTAFYLSALTNDAGQVELNYTLSLTQLIPSLMGLAGALAMMVYNSPLLTAASLVLMLLPVAASLLCGNRLAEAEKTVSTQNESFMDMLRDLLSGFTVIKSFKAEGEIRKLFARSNARLEEAKFRRRRTDYLLAMIGSAASIVAQTGVFLFGAYLAVTGQGITPGTLILFVNLVGQVVTPIQTLPQLWANRKAAKGLVEKLAQAVQENQSASGKAVTQVLRDKLQLRHVTFGYEAEKPVLQDVSLAFARGGSYAVVGGSGSGKSTLLNLLMGGYPAYQGEITLDGEELRQISPDSLYDLIAMVQQNVFVFNATLRENITLFREFPEEKIDQAIRRSGLAALMAAKGPDYPCGENGRGLSGGERQRIAIARCLLRESPILLVDEATAALDAQTAFEVTDAILRIENLTRIVVTHRLEEGLLRRYDEIIVLKNGRVIEQGPFEKLMAEKGYFYSLYTVAN